VHDGAADVAAVPPQPLDPVQPGQAHPRLLQRGPQAGQPADIAHLGVVVQETQDVAAGERGALVERTDQTDVVGVAVVAARHGEGGRAEERLGPVGGGVVDDTQLERLTGAAQALQAGARERELVVDGQDDADHGAHAHSSTGYRQGSRWPRDPEAG
jgi:hypothetical protein